MQSSSDLIFFYSIPFLFEYHKKYIVVAVKCLDYLLADRKKYVVGAYVSPRKFTVTVALARLRLTNLTDSEMNLIKKNENQNLVHNASSSTNEYLRIKKLLKSKTTFYSIEFLMIKTIYDIHDHFI